MRILVVDDSANIRTMLATYLTGEGYQVRTAENGRVALESATEEAPHLVILDIMMPAMNGYEFLRSFRRHSDVPVILLTAKLDEVDKVQGLDLGADDYVIKPFGMRELMARVRAVLRRVEKRVVPAQAVEVNGLVLDPVSHSVRLGERRIDLTPSESLLLATLMSAPGYACSRLELLTILQGNTHDGYERTVDVHVRNLRAKIEPDPRHPQYVQTVYGVGYRFAAEA